MLEILPNEAFMKILLSLLFMILIGTDAYSSDQCSLQAEKYLLYAGHTQPGELVGYTQDGLQIYQVRTNLHGGDAAYEVIVTVGCEYVSHRLIWSE